MLNGQWIPPAVSIFLCVCVCVTNGFLLILEFPENTIRLNLIMNGEGLGWCRNHHKVGETDRQTMFVLGQDCLSADLRWLDCVVLSKCKCVRSRGQVQIDRRRPQRLDYWATSGAEPAPQPGLLPLWVISAPGRHPGQPPAARWALPTPSYILLVQAITGQSIIVEMLPTLLTRNFPHWLIGFESY